MSGATAQALLPSLDHRVEEDMFDAPEVIEFLGVSYRLMSRGRYYLSQTKNRKEVLGLHVAIWEHHHRQKVPKGWVVHHKDEDPFNFAVSNLECITRREHAQRHSSIWRTPARIEHLARIREKAKAWHGSEEGLEWHRKHGAEVCAKRERFPVTCKVCGKVWMAMQKNAELCSHNCQVKWAYRTAPLVAATCTICTSPFRAHARGKRTSKTCSRRCRSLLASQGGTN